jgi:hypothetical protein
MKKLFALSLLALLCACAEAGPTAGTAATGACVKAGCSGQLCVSMDQADMPSTCEWTAAYGCYQQYGKCELQKDGACGWTQNYDLTSCLRDPEDYTGNVLRPELQRDPFGGDTRNPSLQRY